MIGMGDRNASPSAFGWDFQANAAILLMLENIREADKVRVEGADEDIEITLKDKTKIYSQVKSVIKQDDFSNINEKLTAALETLNLDSQNGDGSLFTYTTNSPNPFNNKKTMWAFTGRTHLDFDELPDSCQKKVQNILADKGYSHLDTSLMDVRVIPFYGRDLKNRYKEIQACVGERLMEFGIPSEGISSEILHIWQRDFFQNATQPDTAVSIDKKQMIWPLIVLLVDQTAANDYKKDFDDDECLEIERKYRAIINQQTMLYEFFTKVITDHNKSKKSPKSFVTDNWKDYLFAIENVNADSETKESLIKIILYRILTQRRCINDIKRGVNL